MIYVIDDNRYDQMSKNYRIDYTKELLNYPGKVEWILKVDKSNVDNIANSGACILIHDSVDEKDSKDRLIGLAKERRIPYCIFSNGLTATVFAGNAISSIKKDRLYCNLSRFIQHFMKEGKIQLDILALGVHYDLEKAAIIRERIIELLLANRKNFNYELIFPSGSEAYKDLHELHYLAKIESDFIEFEDKFNKPEVTPETLRLEILRMSKLVKA